MVRLVASMGLICWGFATTPGLCQDTAAPQDTGAPQDTAVPQDKRPVEAESSEAHAAELAAAEARIRKALEEKTDFHFRSTPLNDIARFISQLHNIPVQLDERTLNDAAVELDLPITARLRGVTLGAALELILGRHDLAYKYHNESLLITTAEERWHGEGYTRVYPIADLLGDNPQDEAEEWVELLARTQMPESWDVEGGAGAARAFRKTLVVTQSEDAHARIADLLAAVRHARKEMATGKKTPESYAVGKLAQTLAAWQPHLQKRVNLDFLKMPLPVVREYLQDLTGLPVWLDERALEDNAIPLDFPVTFRQQDISLRAALNAMLRPHDLDWYIRGEVLAITTHDVPYYETEVRIYPVADLARHRNGLYDASELIDLLRTTVRPEMWAEQGGPGEVEQTPDGKILVMAQSFAVHEEFAALLKELREKAELNPPGEPAAKADSSLKRRYVPLKDGVDAAALASVIETMLEPGRWKLPEGATRQAVVAAVPGKLVVEHVPAFVSVVNDLLAQTESAGPAPYERVYRRRTDRVFGWPLSTPTFALGDHPELTVRCYHLPRTRAANTEQGCRPGMAPPRYVPVPAEPYVQAVKKLVEPDSWVNEGPGRLIAIDNVLIVRHTPRMQHMVSETLKQLIELPN